MIDANQEHATMAVTNDANLTPTDLVVDETTGRLLIYIKNETVASEPRTAKIDENQENVALATDGTNVLPIITNDDGYILIDLLCE